MVKLLDWTPIFEWFKTRLVDESRPYTSRNDSMGIQFGLQISVDLYYLRVGSHGVPSPTNVNKSQHGDKCPTFEPQETMKL